jgi:hypothetical protein
MTFPVFASGDVLNASDMNAVGLWLVKSQTIGTGVSTVSVTGAFSADYENYRIVISGGAASTVLALRITLGASSTSYYWGRLARSYGGTTNADQGSNVAFWTVGYGSATGLSAIVDIANPFATDETYFTSSAALLDTSSGEATFNGGYHNSATSFTAFTLATSTGTLTGGTIRVYGYRN